MELLVENMLDCAALVILILVLIYSKTQFTEEFEANRLFSLLIYALMIFVVCDLVGTYTLEYSAQLPVWVNYLVISVYFLAEGCAIIFFFKYVERYLGVSHKKTVAYYVMSFFPALFAFECIFANCFVFIMFEFDKYGGGSYGPLFPMLYYILVYYFVLIVVMLIKNRKSISGRKIRGVSLFMVSTVISTVLQVVLFPDVPLESFGFAIAVLILMLSLEAPDYRRLTSTLKSLEAAREQADKLANLKSFFVADPKHEASQTEYDFKKCIEEIFYSYRQRAAEKHLAYNLETDESIPAQVIGDRALLWRVTNDFISNVILNTKRGRITVRSFAENVTEDSIDIVVAVVDTNINMALERFNMQTAGIEMKVERDRDGYYELSCRIPHKMKKEEN